MKEYDGWAMKGKFGLILNSLHRTRTGVVDWWNCLMADSDPFWKWEDYSRRKGCIRKIVKVKLMEIRKAEDA